MTFYFLANTLLLVLARIHNQFSEDFLAHSFRDSLPARSNARCGIWPLVKFILVTIQSTFSRQLRILEMRSTIN
jgi:hypothetical protein